MSLRHAWLRLRRARHASLVARAEKEATLDLDDGVEGGADYSGILAGALRSHL